MKIVLLGSCESRWNDPFTEGFRKFGANVKSFGLASIDPLGHIYYLFRQKTKKYIEEADLIIFSLDETAFRKNKDIAQINLPVFSCIYKILNSLQKKVLIVQWLHGIHHGGYTYTSFHKIQSEKYGFNFIDVFNFLSKESILDFYANIINPVHPPIFITSTLACKICENFDFFKKPKKIKNLNIPSFQTLDLDEIIDVKNNKDFVKIRSFLCKENIYKLENKKELKLILPAKYCDMKILAVHFWNNSFTPENLLSYCIFENKKQKVLIPVYNHQAIIALEYNFTTNQDIKIHNRLDDDVKKPKYNVFYDRIFEEGKQAGIIGFLLMPKNETLEEIKIPDDLNFEISKEYDFTHLCEYLKDYKIIIEQYNQRKDPIKLQVLQNQINTLKIQLSNSQANSAKARIQNQLSYKLGQAMIENSKSILGYIRMPYVLSYIKDKHKQEQKIYQEKIKKDPSLKLPPLESYADYNEALKFKEHLSYKLGQALIKANNNWYRGGYIKLWFEIRRIKKEFKNKKA
ncbi:hypothetical protein ACD570_02555 [Campylobacter sp. LH-2024]|uniref:hypothetical protein n=2 Tax=Campylobacter TaxID=194 RepID=UPI003AA8B691